jgi:hypothetical protein
MSTNFTSQTSRANSWRTLCRCKVALRWLEQVESDGVPGQVSFVFPPAGLQSLCAKLADGRELEA